MTQSPEVNDRQMLSQSPVLFVLLAVFGVIGLVTILSTAGPPDEPDSHHSQKTAYRPADFPEVFDFDPLADLDSEADAGHVAVPPPPFDDPTMFPCSDCHEGDPGDPEPRDLMEHAHIELRHDEENRWCLDCHLDVDRDNLRLAGGQPVEFAESYRLCGQCHGTQYRDWRNGAHGRRRGYFSGAQSYLLCVHCHNPHAPGFDPLVPLPAPVSPQYYAISEAPTEAPEEGEAHAHE